MGVIMKKGKGFAHHQGIMNRLNFSARVCIYDVEAIVTIDKDTGREVECYFDVMDEDSMECAPDVLIRSYGSKQWFDVREFSPEFRGKVYDAVDAFINKNLSELKKEFLDANDTRGEDER